MSSGKPKPNEPHDRFIKQFIPVVLKHLFNTQTSVSVQLAEDLAIDILCTAIKHDSPIEPDPHLGLLGRLEELSEEDLSFMTYVQEVEEAYQKWGKERRAEGWIEGKIEGKIESASTIAHAKFGSSAINSEVTDRLSQLTEPQLDEFITKILAWQQPDEMITWLENVR